MKTKFLLLLSVFYATYELNAQSYVFNVGMGADTDNISLIYNVSAGIGHTFIENDFVFGGLKFQTYNLVPKSDRDENDMWSTHTVSCFEFFTGMRYAQPIFTKTEKRSNEEYRVGIYPELKLLFNPYVPKNFKYINSNDEKRSITGSFNSQISYSLGFGIYKEMTQRHTFTALHFEFSNSDAFKTIRTFQIEDKNIDFPAGSQFSIGISLFLR